jgi:predicted ATP-grasp superfamily ATP-dependent carboligase
MNELIEIWERPIRAKYMIAGWHQWADAGSISSSLPQYLVKQTAATKIGRIKSEGFYLFQVPGTHHLLRPVVNLEQGHREALEQRTNEFFYADDGRDGLLIFLGEEPHQNEGRYARAFFDAVQTLGVKRVAAVAGVYGEVPYNRDRSVSCVYSLPRMKEDLAQYRVRFSNYEGGATISMYLADQAEPRGVEFFRFCALVPSYTFTTQSVVVQRIALDKDYKAWYDLMMRLNSMFDLGIDLTDLSTKSQDLIVAWRSKIEQLEEALPQLGVREYIERIDADFEEDAMDLSSRVWEEALRDILGDDDTL